MTREDILAMPAGRELDALVAEKVMEWKECSVEGMRTKIAYGKPSHFEDSEPRVRIEEYSTDISAAWEVVGKFETLEVKKFITDKGLWFCEIKRKLWHRSYAPTAPEAICKAALIAVKEESL